eukprot:15789_1
MADANSVQTQIQLSEKKQDTDESSSPMHNNQEKAIVEIQIRMGCVKEIDTINRQFQGAVQIAMRWPKLETETDEPIKENIPKLRPFNIENSFIDTEDIILYGPRIAKKSRKHTSYFDSIKSDIWEIVCEYQGIWTMDKNTEEEPLLDFPFDENNITFLFYLLNSENFELKFIKNYEKNESAFILQRWSFQSVEFDVNSAHTLLWYQFNEQTSCIEHGLEIGLTTTRKWKYYFNQVAVFTFLLAILSFVAYFFDPNDLGQRLGHLTTLILAQIANLYVVNAALPKLPFYTALDVYILNSFLLSVFVTFSSCIVHEIDDHDVAIQVDFISFYVGIVYVMFNNGYLFYKRFAIPRRRKHVDKAEQEQKDKDEAVKLVGKMRFDGVDNGFYDIDGLNSRYTLLKYNWN